MDDASSIPAVLTIVPWPRQPSSRPGFSPASPYLEWIYLPILGPTATLLMHRLSGIALVSGEFAVDVEELAADLGLGRATGRNSRLRSALDRLVHFGLARWNGPAEYAVLVDIPPLGDREAARLTETIRAMHTIAVEQLTNHQNHRGAGCDVPGYL